MKELIITNFTGEVEHLLLEEKKTFKADKEEFIVIDLSNDHIILSSLNYNNVILRDDIQTKLGRISLEPLSENSNKSKINVIEIEFNNQDWDEILEKIKKFSNLFEQFISNKELQKIILLGKKEDADSILYSYLE